jgi:hypothetical protein
VLILFKLKCNSNVPKERGGFPEMDDYKWVLIDEARDYIILKLNH